MITSVAGATFEAVVQWGDPGLYGTIGVRLEDGLGAIVIARHVTGITESPPASGIYTTTMLAPTTPGTYTIIWDDGTDFAPEQVTVTSAGDPPPTAPPTATALLALKTQSTVDPVLTSGELATLLATFALPDAAGRAVGSDGWIATYDMERAAAEGWRWKAGRVSDRTDIADEAAQIKRSQLHDHCIAMARMYDAKAAAADAKTVTTTRPLARFTPC